MQEIKKQSIVIASILKPVDDTRMYEKMGKTLNETGSWDVHIIGYGKPFKQEGFHIHSLGEFGRLSPGRLLAPLKTLSLLIKIKPRILIFNTHELLNIAVVMRLLSKCRVIYDVRENYFLNIIYTNAFPALLKHAVALWVRVKEWITSGIINHFLLAEISYQRELGFIRKKFTVVENKAVVPENFQRRYDKNKIRLLFSGTIDSSTGIREAIQLGQELYKTDDRVQLQICGYCARKELRSAILKRIQEHPYITVGGFNKLVSHHTIIEEIGNAMAGIVYYPPSAHNRDRLPTKVYEYMACHLPILFDSQVSWREKVLASRAGIAVNFTNPDPKEILAQLAYQKFYPHPVPEARWSSEKEKFLTVIRDLNAR